MGGIAKVDLGRREEGGGGRLCREDVFGGQSIGKHIQLSGPGELMGRSGRVLVAFDMLQVKHVGRELSNDTGNQEYDVVIGGEAAAEAAVWEVDELMHLTDEAFVIAIQAELKLWGLAAKNKLLDAVPKTAC